LQFLKLQIFKLHQRHIRPSLSSPRNFTLIKVLYVILVQWSPLKNLPEVVGPMQNFKWRLQIGRPVKDFSQQSTVRETGLNQKQ